MIILRVAKLVGQYAYWDGTARKVILEDAFNSVDEFGYSGDAVGISIRILVFSSQGTLLFKGQAGIELLHKIIYENGIQKPVLRRNLFQNIKWNENAIRTAFHPFYTMKEYPKHPKFNSINEK